MRSVPMSMMTLCFVIDCRPKSAGSSEPATEGDTKLSKVVLPSRSVSASGSFTSYLFTGVWIWLKHASST